jgi:glycosyltransferase involved in cell wall biosynthesis
LALVSEIALPSELGRPVEPGRAMLTVLNGGRMSRHWLAGIGNGAIALGLRHSFIEIDAIRDAIAKNAAAAVAQINQILIQQKIGLVLNYGLNAVTDLPTDREWPGAYRNFFEVRGIPQCLIWADHPQWVADKQALDPSLQPAFRSGNQFHFLKSGAHAFELNRMLGWPNCHELPCGADPAVLQPASSVTPEFDVVAIYGGANEQLPEWLIPFLSQDDPDVNEINQAAAQQVRAALVNLWQSDAPPALRPELEKWTERIIELKLAHPTWATIRHIGRLCDEFPMSTWWLTAMYPVYFKATTILYALRSWQRHFYLAFLSKYFRVALFGGRWSHVGGDGQSAAMEQWVDFAQMPNVLARGRIALDIVSGWDEEGLTAKTFEIAACGMAMIHNDCVGLCEAFTPQIEIEVFNTPKEARQAVQSLLENPARRGAMAQACRARFLRQHTWSHRVQRMFELAGIPIDAFRGNDK